MRVYYLYMKLFRVQHPEKAPRSVRARMVEPPFVAPGAWRPETSGYENTATPYRWYCVELAPAHVFVDFTTKMHAGQATIEQVWGLRPGGSWHLYAWRLHPYTVHVDTRGRLHAHNPITGSVLRKLPGPAVETSRNSTTFRVRRELRSSAR